MAQKKRQPRKRSTTRFNGLRSMCLRFTIMAVVAATGYAAWLDLSVRSQFEGKRWSVPARIYARPMQLHTGMHLSARDLQRELKTAGYTESRNPKRPGTFRLAGGSVDVMTRAFDFWDGTEPARRLHLRLAGNRIVEMRDGGQSLDLARLDPALIGHVYAAHHEDRVLVRLAEVPPLLIKALLAVEDRSFYQHFGLSLRGIARALMANLQAGATVQGGSTLTQQLAKNFFLSPDRSVVRKLNEALIAVLLEAHFSKEEILEAYLNEVYLGQQGRRAIHGFGLGAHFYFGRPLDELRLPEFALLVALVRGASVYNPRRHSARALNRRNLVLQAMTGEGYISAAQAKAAAAAPLGVTAEPPDTQNRHPAYLDLVRRQLHRDYHDEDLRSEGLRIFTTLDPAVQRQAERSLREQAAKLEKRVGLPRGKLQGATIVSSTDSGEVLAVVGGRRARDRGFNRALDARRPIGSLVKPAVYLTALEESNHYNLVTELDDRPIRIKSSRGEIWSPSNYDGVEHGSIPLYAALANSYNLATVRLGMELGIDRVRDKLRALGVDQDIPSYPSLLLGAVALSPLEVTQVYQTLASGGFRTPLRAIRAVTDKDGRPLTRYGLSVTQVAPAGPVFLLTKAMEETMRNGTGRSAYRRLPEALSVAGKTGTTDELRDSWFAGFSADRVVVVWLGLDDNSPARLTGASGALQVWSDLMGRLSPRSLDSNGPPDVEWHWTNTAAGLRTDEGCPGALWVPFVRGSSPAYNPCGEARFPGTAIPAG